MPQQDGGREASAKKKKARSVSYYDISLLFLVVCLAGFGLMMIYSTTAYSDLKTYGSEWNSTKNQALYLVVLLGVSVFGISRIDYHQFTKWAAVLYVLELFLLVYVLMTGSSANGSTRWIQIGPATIQPSEFAKPVVIVLLARFFQNNYGGVIESGKMIPKKVPSKEDPKKMVTKMVYKHNYFFIRPAFMALVLVGMVLVENLSTSLIILMITYALMFIADARKKRYLIMAGAALAIVGIVIALVKTGNQPFFLKGYQGDRILAWLDPEKFKEKTGYQILQGLFAIGSGGLTGKGLGSSIQKLGYLPEAQNDMVFAIICEELGLLGAMFVIILFVLLLWRILMIAMNAPDIAGFLICAGVFVHFALQVCMNIAVVTNSMPNTGVGLPFISSGGSALAVCIGEIALVLNVSSQIHTEK